MQKRGKIILASSLAALVALGIIAFDTRLETTWYIIESEKITTPVSFALVTDLHSCDYGEGMTELISAVDAAAPDFILLVGDIADDVLPSDNTYTFVQNVAARYPCYYVTGNHEIWSGRAEQVKADFREFGVTVFEGGNAVVDFDGTRLNLCGIDDTSVGGPLFRKQLPSAFLDIEPDSYTILMAHRPERINQYSKYACDLVVSGHAHGGQWRIPFTDISLFAPNQDFFPKYTSGVYTYSDTKLLVSRGLARESTRVPRLFNRPELVMVELRG